MVHGKKNSWTFGGLHVGTFYECSLNGLQLSLNVLGGSFRFAAHQGYPLSDNAVRETICLQKCQSQVTRSIFCFAVRPSPFGVGKINVFAS